MGHQDYHSRLLKHISHSGPRLKPLSSGRPDFRISVLKPAQLSDNSFPPLMRQRTKTFFFFKVCKESYGALMGLWACGFRDLRTVSRIMERKIWQKNKERKIVPWKLFQSLSNYNYYKDHLTIKESTLIGFTNFWKMTKYKLEKATKGKQVNLGLAAWKTLIWTNWRKASAWVSGIPYLW